MRLGTGLPLVFLPGLTSTHRLPHGQDRRLQLQEIKPFAAKREVSWANRRPGPDPDATMADIAADYAETLRTSFGRQVDVLGFSTGGSVALQLAVDHPDVVRRLVILSAAGRLSSTGPGCSALQPTRCVQGCRVGRRRQ
jgi:pimeloyl-ACP methyl ester carboxylesterase